MKVIFMGTPDIAVATLTAIIEAGHEVILVVSQPDKAVGRSKALKYTPVKACAIEHGIEVYQPEKIRAAEAVAHVTKYRPDIIIVEAFGQIIPKEILELPPYGCINVHASLLPKYRGAAPIQWAVINGEKVTGVTTMRMDEGLDTGDMILKREITLSENETSGSLFLRMADEGAALCVETIKAIADGTATYTPQDVKAATHTAKIRKELGNIEWTKSAKEIECLIRGTDPWPGAYTRLGGRVLKIWKAKVQPDTGTSGDKAAPGCIVEADKKRLLVQTGDGILELLEVQPEGKKRMSVSGFLNGNPVQQGTFLHRC